MVLGRFAPSPTGVLHLGNLRTALASWLSIRAAGGRWIIRMEDVDGPRCRRELGVVQLRDLAALGLESDVPVVWQSERSSRYHEALARLREAGRLYPCVCTRRDLQLLASAPHVEDGLRPYPGRCRERAWEGFDRALRFRLPDGRVAWEDLLLRAQADDPVAMSSRKVEMSFLGMMSTRTSGISRILLSALVRKNFCSVSVCVLVYMNNNSLKSLIICRRS